MSFGNKFPQPTRPASSYNIHEEFQHPKVLEVPKQSQPKGDHATTSTTQFSPPTGKTPTGEKEAVDELLLILVECMDELNTRSRGLLLKKFFSEIENDERLERFIEERLKQSKVKAISELREQLHLVESSEGLTHPSGDSIPMMRGLQETVNELAEKLERFKVKTLDVIEEEKKLERFKVKTLDVIEGEDEK